jgi:hypothetical protein
MFLCFCSPASVKLKNIEDTEAAKQKLMAERAKYVVLPLRPSRFVFSLRFFARTVGSSSHPPSPQTSVPISNCTSEVRDAAQR